MKKAIISALGAIMALQISAVAQAKTEVEFWHAFTGRLGELVAEQVSTFNASQSQYEVVQRHKGNYSETLNSGIAAFRAGEQPQILMVYEVGTATMMAARGATKPVYQVMADAGASFDQSKYIGAVKGYYTAPDGNMLSLPFNSSTPVLWVNRDMLQQAGLGADVDLSTWERVGAVLDYLHAAGVDCPLTTAWQSWIHLENLSAYHNVPFASKANGFGGTDTELQFNSAAQVAHIAAMGAWAQEGKFFYAGQTQRRRRQLPRRRMRLVHRILGGLRWHQERSPIRFRSTPAAVLGGASLGAAKYHHRRCVPMGDGWSRR